MQSETFSSAVQVEAQRLGFDHCHITRVTEAPHADFFDAWLNAGRAGEMTYLARNQEKRRSPAQLARPGDPEFRSMIVLAVNYHQFDLPSEVRDDPSRGLIASYAWGDDYHEIIRPLLYELDAFICRESGRTTLGKCLVDSGPVLERDWAMAAGVGFSGKNCCTIHPLHGSWLLLATMLIPEDLAPTAEPRSFATGTTRVEDGAVVSVQDVLAGLRPNADYGTWRLPDPQSPGGNLLATCGRCTRCLDGCPTNAFTGPYHLDPQRCISYWTIETQAAIPLELRPLFGNRIFGCDICQEVCPYNRRLPVRTPLLDGLRAKPDRSAPPLLDGFSPDTPYWLADDAFAQHFRRSPIKRAQRHGMLRNVCVALGNWASPQTIGALTLALHDANPISRGHAAWALGRVVAAWQVDSARQTLIQRLNVEQDEWVQTEIVGALKGA